MQTDSRILDDFAKLATAAMGTFTGMRAEVEARLKDQLERWLADMNLVRREEFEAAMALATNARSAQEDLETRVAALEAELAALRPAAPGAKSTGAKGAGAKGAGAKGAGG